MSKADLDHARELLERFVAMDVVGDELTGLKVDAEFFLARQGRIRPGLDKSRAAAKAVRAEQAAEYRKILMPAIATIQARGDWSYQSIADALNAEGPAPRFAERWRAPLVYEILKKAKAQGADQ